MSRPRSLIAIFALTWSCTGAGPYVHGDSSSGGSSNAGSSSGGSAVQSCSSQGLSRNCYGTGRCFGTQQCVNSTWSECDCSTPTPTGGSGTTLP
ncbi:MAG TPA: hypothetical protein VL137_03555 [Polyangiaceae bacterium]|nr:hypothetical protein [Polyangiaceae bacterium]